MENFGAVSILEDRRQASGSLRQIVHRGERVGPARGKDDRVVIIVAVGNVDGVLEGRDVAIGDMEGRGARIRARQRRNHSRDENEARASSFSVGGSLPVTCRVGSIHGSRGKLATRPVEGLPGTI